MILYAPARLKFQMPDKELFKARVFGKINRVNAGRQFFHFFSEAGVAQKRRRPRQGRVSGKPHLSAEFRRQKPGVNEAVFVEVITKGTGYLHRINIGGADTETGQQRLNARADGPFGKLDLADILLGQEHRTGDIIDAFPVLLSQTVMRGGAAGLRFRDGKPAVGFDEAGSDQLPGNIQKAAAADPLGFAAADHLI